MTRCSVGIEIDCCCVGSRNRRDFSVGDRSWLAISVGSRVGLVLCGGLKWLGLESGSNLPWFSCGVMQNRLIFRVGIEIYLTSVLGSKLTWCYVGEINWLAFSGRNVFVRGSKLTLFLCAGRRLLILGVTVAINWVFVMVIKLDLLSVWGIQLDLISV